MRGKMPQGETSAVTSGAARALPPEQWDALGKRLLRIEDTMQVCQISAQASGPYR